jgi:L-asparaginase
VFGNRPGRHRPLPAVDAGPDPRVALLTTHLADSGELLRLVVDADYDGVVLAAAGVGHVSAAVAETVSEAAERLPVVFASRTGGGPTATGSYGFVGSEADLIARGATPAGWLAPLKARLLLWALLRDGAPAARIGSQFARRGCVADGGWA